MQRVPNKMNPKRPTPRHIIMKIPKVKDKERVLKAARERQLVAFKGSSYRLSADFSTETFQTIRNWHEIFKVMKSKDLQSRLLYPGSLLFKIEKEIKSFPDKKKLKESVRTNRYYKKCYNDCFKKWKKKKNNNKTKKQKRGTVKRIKWQ